jgi:hypothetical protein
MILLTAGIIAAVTATTTTTLATTVASVSVGVGITAGIVKKIADDIEEENYASVQKARNSAKEKINSTQQVFNEKKEQVKSQVIKDLQDDVKSSSLNKTTKSKLIKQLNLPKTNI